MNSPIWMSRAGKVLGAARKTPGGNAGAACPEPRNSQKEKRQIGLLAVLLTLAALLLIPPGTGKLAAAGDQAAVPEGGGSPDSILDFEGGVRLALHQSPYFTKSSLEIDIRRLDETDSRFGLLPTVNFRTSYYVDRPRDVLNSKPYTLGFTSDTYNPVEAYFTLQVRKILTQMAILNHVKVISNGLGRMGKIFLELDLLKRSLAYQEEIIELARQSLSYAENRLSLGTGTSLEVKVAAQELEMARAEKERIQASQARVLGNLRSLLGMKAGEKITADLREVRRQVLGKFEPTEITLDQVKSRSYDLKIQELSRKLQTYNVTMAKAKLLPKFFMGAVTPDPLSLTTGSGLYFHIGLELPVWDGLTRYRNISRQKAILRQFDADKELKEQDMNAGWLSALEDWRNAAAARKLAVAQEELAQLRERQAAIRYQSGNEPLPTFVEGRKGFLEAKKNAALKALDCDLALLNLRQLSGDLGYTYVNESSWQQ